MGASKGAANEGGSWAHAAQAKRSELALPLPLLAVAYELWQ